MAAEYIQERIDALLSEAETVMQLIGKSIIPCEQIIVSALQRIDKLAYFADTSLEAKIGDARYPIHLRKKYPIEMTSAENPRTDRIPFPGEQLGVTIDLNSYNWYKHNYQIQLIIVKSLPRLLEKLIKNIKRDYGTQDEELQFDVPWDPNEKKKKKKWWQRKAK